MKIVGIAATSLVASGLVFSSALAADDPQGTPGPWPAGDMAYSPTPADERPNAQSQAIVTGQYRALAPETLFDGEKGKLRFHVAPRD
jgi:hypothetical protein